MVKSIFLHLKYFFLYSEETLMEPKGKDNSAFKENVDGWIWKDRVILGKIRGDDI